MKICFFGSTGYIAGYVYEELLAEGHELILIKRPGSSNFHFQDQVQNLTAETHEVRELISRLQPDVVLNMANYFVKTQEPLDIEKFDEVNCQFITEISFGCVAAGASLFHVGSAWQATFDNNDPSLGNSYALYKGLAVQIIEWFCKSYGLNSIILNLYDTYGRNDPRGKIVQFLVDQIGAESKLELSGGEQILELVHVSDIARAISLGLYKIEKEIITQSDVTGVFETYWCYPAQANTLKEIVHIIDSNTSNPISVEWGARPYRVGEKFEREISGKPTIPGWQQEIQLSDGINDLIFGQQLGSK